jgi:cyclase
MIGTRVIPCLLLKNKALVKTVKFKKPTYVGCPINAIRIFNEKEVDELIFLDIEASKEERKPLFNRISEIAGECFMPFCYGGGIRNLQDIKKVLSIGAEKVSINTQAILNPNLIKQASEEFGSQSIVVSIDIKLGIFKKSFVFSYYKNKLLKLSAIDFALEMEKKGAGELLVNFVDRDGTMKGYDIDTLKKITSAVNIPVIACGGAGSLNDFRDAIEIGGASAVAAGSLFVFYGRHRAVLINYPDAEELSKALGATK